MGEVLRQALDGDVVRAIAVRRRILLRALEVSEWLDDTPFSAERDVAFAEVAPLTSLSISCEPEKVSPFFWLNLARFYDAAESGIGLRVATGRLLALAFDAFFEQFPYDLELRVNLGPGTHLVMPYLGVLRRRDDQDCILSRSLFDQDESLNAPQVPGAAGRVLAVADAALFEDAYRDEIVTKPDVRFTERLASALEFVRVADHTTGARIADSIEWYVPIASPDAATHCSFTSPRLHGVTFLSQSDDTLRLAEAIVHEHSHMELHLLMSVEPLTGNISPDARFYSPWRPDPRPIAGLFHGLYVFSEVLSFLAALADRGACFDTAAITHRMTIIAHRLRLGLSQVPREHLAPLGAAILDEVEVKTEEHLLTLDTATPLLLRDHLHQWLSSHPDLASRVVLAI